jgi:hypothetical protein
MNGTIAAIAAPSPASIKFRRGGQVCREFTGNQLRRGRDFTRTGIAAADIGNGHWRFD